MKPNNVQNDILTGCSFKLRKYAIQLNFWDIFILDLKKKKFGVGGCNLDEFLSALR